ncbi:hypothetical protein [Arthrobacter sp. TE12232]
MKKDEYFAHQAVTKASIDKVMQSQQPLAVSEVARLRRVNPDKSPAELASHLNRSFLREVRRIGAAAGAATIGQRAPGDPRELRQASALYMLTLAEIHSLHPEDFERRTQLLEFVLAGNVLSRATTSEPVKSRTVPHLAKKLIDSIPMSAINRANDVLGPEFVTELFLGQRLPPVIGGSIGAGGYYLSGWIMIMTAKKILDPPPESWDGPQSSETGPEERRYP